MAIRAPGFLLLISRDGYSEPSDLEYDVGYRFPGLMKINPSPFSDIWLIYTTQEV